MTSPQISERRLAANRANARKSTGPRTAAGKQRVAQNACRHRLYSKIHTLDPAFSAFNHQRALSISAQYADPALRQLHYQLWIEHGYCELAFSIQDDLYAQSNAAYPDDPDFANYTVLCQDSLLRALQRFQNRHTRRFDALVATIHKFNQDAAKSKNQTQAIAAARQQTAEINEIERIKATAAQAAPQPQSACQPQSPNTAFSTKQTHPQPLPPNKSCQIEQTNPPHPATIRRNNVISIDQFTRVPLRSPPLSRAHAA
jgi:hypothetical protein